jgi:ribonuclease P protein component
VLPKANRVVHAADFRRIVRSGRRQSSPVAVLHITEAEAGVSRFGFVVSKKVGNAVVRNRIRRRMSEIVRAGMPVDPPVDVVVRALPRAATADFATLTDAFTTLLRSR